MSEISEPPAALPQEPSCLPARLRKTIPNCIIPRLISQTSSASWKSEASEHHALDDEKSEKEKKTETITCYASVLQNRLDLAQVVNLVYAVEMILHA